MNTEALATFVMKVMDACAEDFDDDAVFRTVALVAEVDSGDATHIFVAADDDRPWLQIEFLQQGIDSIEHRLAAMREDD